MNKPRRCRTCGKGTMEERIGNRHYDESGVKGVVLIGIPLRRCDTCKAEEF